MKRVFAYLRVSGNAQDWKRQIELIELYCDKNKHTIVDKTDEPDIKVSGAIADRNGVNKLLSLSSDNIDMVIMSETSRLSREDDIMELLIDVRKILKAGIDVLFLDGEKLFKAGENFTLFQIMQLSFEAQANSDERRKITIRTLTGRKSKAKQGCYVGGYKPFGYTTINNPLRIGDSKEHGAKLLIIDESQRKTVETIFDLIANKGYTLKNVAIFLNNSGLNIHGIKWSYSAIKYIIHNPIYTGVYNYSDTVTQIDSIINKELFDKVQEQIKINAIQYNTGVKHFNLLKGIIKCPCGGSLTIAKKTNGIAYYHCAKKHSHSYIDYECNNKGVNAEKLNSIVWKVTQAFINKTDFKLKTEQASKNINTEVEQLESNISKQAANYDKNETEIESTLNLLLSCTEAEKGYINKKFTALVETQTELKKQIAKLNIQLSKLISKRKDFTMNLESELIANLSDTEKNTIYKKYIQAVTYYSVTNYKGFIVIDFKNGFKSVISYMNRNTLTAYELPQNCSFNAENRTVISIFSGSNNTTFNPESELFNIPADYAKELTYNELEKTFYIDEYLMQL